MKFPKALKVICVLLVLIILFGWYALGPGTRLYLSLYSNSILKQLEMGSEWKLDLVKIEGDFLSGFKIESLENYSDSSWETLLLRIDVIEFELSVWNLITQNFYPDEIRIDGFRLELFFDEDGTALYPTVAGVQTLSRNKILTAGISTPPYIINNIKCSFKNGQVNLHKEFESIRDEVSLAFLDVGGEVIYTPDGTIEIVTMDCDYLATPLKINGSFPAVSESDVDITVTTENIYLTSVYNDFEPILGDSLYLPDGDLGCTVNISGPPDNLEIMGTAVLTDSTIANLSIPTASCNFVFASGVLDLDQFSAGAYGGRLNASGHVNFLSEYPIWSVDGEFSDMDIPSYLRDNGYLKYELTGEFDGQLSAGGDFHNRNSLECTVSISSDGGEFLTPFSEKFMATAQGAVDESPVDESDLAEYSILETDAEIRQSRIIINRFRLVSEDLQIEANGTVGFDKTVNCEGALSIPVARAKRHPTFGQWVDFLPDSLERASLVFEVTGTLDQPELSASPTENLIRGIVDNSSDLLHDIGRSLR